MLSHLHYVKLPLRAEAQLRCPCHRHSTKTHVAGGNPRLRLVASSSSLLRPTSTSPYTSQHGFKDHLRILLIWPTTLIIYLQQQFSGFEVSWEMCRNSVVLLKSDPLLNSHVNVTQQDGYSYLWHLRHHSRSSEEKHSAKSMDSIIFYAKNITSYSSICQESQTLKFCMYIFRFVLRTKDSML